MLTVDAQLTLLPTLSRDRWLSFWYLRVCAYTGTPIFTDFMVLLMHRWADRKAFESIQQCKRRYCILFLSVRKETEPLTIILSTEWIVVSPYCDSALTDGCPHGPGLLHVTT